MANVVSQWYKLISMVEFDRRNGAYSVDPP